MIDHVVSRRRRRRRPYQQLLDPAIRSKLITYLRAGNTRPVAATLVGVPLNTIDEWVRRGRGEDERPATPQYVAFAEEVAQAEAHAHMYAVSMVRQGMAEDPRLAVWFLENRAPEWRQRRAPVPAPQQLTVNAPTKVVVIDLATLEAEGLRRVEQLQQPMKQVGDGTGNAANDGDAAAPEPEDEFDHLVEDSGAAATLGG